MQLQGHSLSRLEVTRNTGHCTCDRSCDMGQHVNLSALNATGVHRRQVDVACHVAPPTQSATAWSVAGDSSRAFRRNCRMLYKFDAVLHRVKRTSVSRILSTTSGHDRLKSGMRAKNVQNTIFRETHLFVRLS